MKSAAPLVRIFVFQTLAKWGTTCKCFMCVWGGGEGGGRGEGGEGEREKRERSHQQRKKIITQKDERILCKFLPNKNNS